MDIFRLIIHQGLHFVFPGLLAWMFFKARWIKAWIIMVLTMLVDLDHLLAVPVYASDCCSIGFHPLHSGYTISIYICMFFFSKTRIIAAGLLLHMLADYLDCLWI